MIKLTKYSRLVVINLFDQIGCDQDGEQVDQIDCDQGGGKVDQVDRVSCYQVDKVVKFTKLTRMVVIRC